MVGVKIDLSKFRKEERKSVSSEWNRNYSDFFLEEEKKKDG